MNTENMNKALITALTSYNARKTIKDVALDWAAKIKTLVISNDEIKLIYTDDAGEEKTVTKVTAEFFSDIFARHDYLLLPTTPQSQYPDIVEWLGDDGKITRETTTGKVWLYVKPDKMASIPKEWVWGLPKGSVSDAIPPGFFSIVLEKNPELK